MNVNYLRNYSPITIKWVSIVSFCFAFLLLTTPQSALAQNAPSDITSRPEIEIEHLAVASHVLPGEAAEFTVAVTNTGNIRLENVTVSNTSAPDCARAIGIMEPSQTYNYTCELQDVRTSATSRSTVVGAAAHSPLVVDSAEATVELMSPILAIIPNPAQGQTRGGERIVKTYNYANSGSGAAVGVQLVEIVPENTQFVPEASDAGWACENDSVAPGTVCFYTIDLIEAGESATGQFPFVVLQDEEVGVIGSGATVAQPDDMSMALFLPFVSR